MVQEFGHPQARFLHEKRWHLSPGVQRALQPLLGLVNRATFFAIDSAMFTGTVCFLHPVIDLQGSCRALLAARSASVKLNNTL